MIFVPTDNEKMEIQPIDTLGGRETNYLYLTDCEVAGRRRPRRGRTPAGCS